VGSGEVVTVALPVFVILGRSPFERPMLGTNLTPVTASVTHYLTARGRDEARLDLIGEFEASRGSNLNQME
jgi:hypothetical protein